VDTARFRQVVDIFFEETRGPGIRSMVGVIGLSTANIVERLRYAYERGFRAFQISLPCWGALNDKELLTFFKDVCGTFPDGQFLHYNLPRTKRVLTAADYRRIADAVPNLVATKNCGTTVQTTAELMRTVPEIQHFFSETMFPVGCLYGTCSLLSSYGPLFPTRTQEFFEYGKHRQLDKVFPMLKEHLDVVTDIFGPTKGEERIDGAYDKMLVRLGGIDMPLRLLSPYDGFPESVFEQCRRILYEKHGDWLR
jgi:dihydrodipicolinate synthase/N-acetylneuraminate lyase